MGGTAIASLFGANKSADAAKQAAATQAKTAAENRALADQYTGLSLDDLDAALGGALGSLDQGRGQAASYLQPYADAGGDALQSYKDAVGLNGPEGTARAQAAFKTSPGYQFRLDQGTQAINRGANARGGYYAGNTLKALSDYGQNTAADEWGKYTGGLAGLASGGQSAAGGLADLTANSYGSEANALLGAGSNRAQTRAAGLGAITDANSQGGAATAGGYINQANAWNSGLSNLATLAGAYAGNRRPAPANAMGF